jgi:oxygen-dependent protoporphyrinogen oxidase
VVRDAGGWRVADHAPYDAVILAVPAPAAAELLRGSDAALADDLVAIEYASTAIVSVAFDREAIPHPLDGFGFVVPLIERRSLLAGTFSSIKFPGRAPATLVLIRAFVGGALRPEVVELDDGALLDLVRRDLADLLGVRAEPVLTRISRWPRSMPQYAVGHLERAARIARRVQALPGLRLAGNAYDGVGIPDCIRSGEAAAESLLPPTHPHTVECD